jgi:hypothetical protein
MGDCVGTCSAASPSASNCLGDCGRTLGGCQQEVATNQRVCIADCRGASDKPGCIGACTDASSSGRQTCLAAFASCQGGCGVSTTTQPEPSTTSTTEAEQTTTTAPVPTTTSTTLIGSPSGAFVQ